MTGTNAKKIFKRQYLGKEVFYTSKTLTKSAKNLTGFCQVSVKTTTKGQFFSGVRFLKMPKENGMQSGENSVTKNL